MTLICSNGTKLQSLADIVPLNMPMSISLSLGNACNLKCNYCYHGSVQKEQDTKNGNFKLDRMTRETVDLIVGQAKEFNGKFKQATLVGSGEPLVNKDIVYIIKQMKKIAERVKLVTNATLLTEEMSLQLIDAGLDLIKISFQGMTDLKYNKICGVNISVKKLLEQISFLYEHRGQCKIHVKIVDAALDAGEEEIFYKTFKKMTDCAWIEKLSKVDDTGKWIDGENRWNNAMKRVEVCYFPFYYIYINSDGGVYPCCNAVEGMSMGNIMKKPLKYIWETEIYNLCKAQLVGALCDYEPCINCNVVQAMMREENNLDEKRNEILYRMVK